MAEGKHFLMLHYPLHISISLLSDWNYYFFSLKILVVFHVSLGSLYSLGTLQRIIGIFNLVELIFLSLRLIFHGRIELFIVFR